MTDIDITCTPADGILTLSAEHIAALDVAGQATAALLGHDIDWRIEVRHPTATLTARPAHDREDNHA